jgi:hypothetical protein
MINRFALALSAAMLLPAAAAAATYSAKPVATGAPTRIIARDISWKCGPAACQGSTEYGRPVVLCQALARQVGRIESFIVDGQALPTAALDKCNSVAPAAAGQLLARN